MTFGAITLLILLVTIGIFSVVSLKVSPDANDIFYGYMVQSHVETNNLTIPYKMDKETFPNRLINQERKEAYDMPLDKFHQVIKNNYYYDENYDCKYYSYVWSSYILSNKDRYNMSIDFKKLGDNHLYVIAYNSTRYCSFDQTEMDCRNITIN